MMLSNMRRWQGWTKLEQTKTPTLVITGERDRYFPRRVFQGVGERIAGAVVTAKVPLPVLLEDQPLKLPLSKPLAKMR